MKINPRIQTKAKIGTAFLWVFLLGAVAQVLGEDHFKEFNFENSPFDWRAGYHGEWKPASSFDSPFTVTLDEANPHSGAFSMKMDLQANTDAPANVSSPRMQIPEGSNAVTVHFYFRSKNLTEGECSVGVLQFDESSSPTSFIRTEQTDRDGWQHISSSESWEEVVLIGHLSPGTQSILIMLRVEPQATASQMWFDDFTVEFHE